MLLGEREIEELDVLAMRVAAAGASAQAAEAGGGPRWCPDLSMHMGGEGGKSAFLSCNTHLSGAETIQSQT